MSIGIKKINVVHIFTQILVQDEVVYQGLKHKEKLKKFKVVR